MGRLHSVPKHGARTQRLFFQWTMNNEGKDKVLKTVQAVNKTIKHLMDMVSNFEETIAANSPQQQRKRNGLKQYSIFESRKYV